MTEKVVPEDIINGDNPITEADLVEVKIEEPSSVAETTEQTPSIPEKYQGKSVEDIIKMHQESEKQNSRLGNELGDSRKLVDQVLQRELANQQPVQIEEELDWDFAPQEAASKYVQQEVGAVKQELNQIKQETALSQFMAKHPNANEDSNSPEFIEWANSSPYRAGLLAKQRDGIDFLAAEELLSGWEEVKQSSQVTAEASEAKRKEDLKAASMEKGASTGGSRKKTWSRKYIIDLQLHDKATYNAHKDEIMAAYREGRVTK